jgi:hypothetical protein
VPLTLVTTPGASNANAYADLAQTLAVAAYRGPSGETFIGLTADEQISAIASFAAELDAVEYEGQPLSVAQSMAWPRTGEDGIPVAIVRASIEGAILRAPSFDGSAAEPAPSPLDPDRQALKALGVGPVKLQFDTGAADATLLADPALASIAHLPLIVQRLIAPYVRRRRASFGASVAVRAS